MTLLVVLIVFILCCAALGLLVPRFLGAVARRLWERRLRRRQERLELRSDLGLTAYDDGEHESLLRDERGAAMPSTLVVVTVIATGYLAFVGLRQILRSVGLA